MPDAIVEFDWRGRVYCGKFQVLAHGDDERPGDGALFRSDKRVNHKGQAPGTERLDGPSSIDYELKSFTPVPLLIDVRIFR